MHSSALLALVASMGSAAAAGAIQGFNYGSTNTDQSPVTQQRFQELFTTAKGLVGHSGFTSARLYTMIQGGTTNDFTEAIPAAIDTQTTLLFGMWCSAGQDAFNNEIAALKSAISQYGSKLSGMVEGISVGSEDLYRISPTGIENQSGAGADPATLVSYIGQVRSALQGSPLANVPIGHVDTWTAWVNGSNDAVINAIDWLGVDAYPYFQTTDANSIQNGNSTFFQAYDNTVGVAGGKDVWITETGWPVSGPTSNLAIPSIANAKSYWDAVACNVLGRINTYWYTLQDSYPTTPSPSFGIVGSTLSTTPLFDLTCPKVQASGANGASQGTSSPSPSPSSPKPNQSSGPSEASSPAPGQGSGSSPSPNPGSGSGSGSSTSSDTGKSSGPSSSSQGPISNSVIGSASSGASSGTSPTASTATIPPTGGIIKSAGAPTSTGGAVMPTAAIEIALAAAGVAAALL